MIESHRFVKADAIKTILSIMAKLSSSFVRSNSFGNVSAPKIVYFLLNRPITRSTWILTEAIFRVFSTSKGQRTKQLFTFRKCRNFYLSTINSCRISNVKQFLLGTSFSSWHLPYKLLEADTVAGNAALKGAEKK